MKTIDFSHFIERYLAGEMGEDEKQWFEKELEGNANLRAEVVLRRKTDDILKQQDIMALRSKLGSIEKKRKEAEVAPVRRPGTVYLKYAAVLTALVLIGSIFIFKDRYTGTDELISKYYRPYDPPAVQRSVNASVNADFSLALEFYNTSDYTHAAQLFSKVVQNNPKDMQSVLLYGVSSFEDKKYPEAKKSFVTVIDDNNNLFIESAQWYLALCYIKTEENEKARGELQLIVKEGGLYARNARKLMKSLK